MKKFLLLLTALIFLAVSCGGSKNVENDAAQDADAAVNDKENSSSEKSDHDISFFIDPCDPNPCSEIEHSSGECTPEAHGNYSCGCIEEYFWDNGKCVNPCEDVSCGQFAHASGECKPQSALTFSCDCDEDYFWGHPGCKKIAFPNICTGQTECFNKDGIINCPAPGEPFYGQDAQYAGLGNCIEESFSQKSHLGDGFKMENTVFDNNLKIEWTAEISGEKCSWYDAEKYCDELEYAGHDDWRLPTAQELYYSKARGKADLWSSDDDAGDDSKAWILNTGKEWEIRNKNPSSWAEVYVQCVRGNRIGAGISFNKTGRIKEEIAFDYENGLAWQLNGKASLSMTDALAYCETSSYSGFSDWRLPNINELASLVNHAKSLPATDLPVHLVQNVSWSSTTIPYTKARVADFKAGELGSIGKENSKWANILCVRNEPCKEDWFWNGGKCVLSPCADGPCKNIEHSDGTCYLNDFESYFCGCAEGYFWDGGKCVDPCDPDPCRNDKNSTGECTALSFDFYNCGCSEGYFWNGKKCINPCDGVSCSELEHGAGECRTDNAFNYSCGCVEGYWWWGKEKGCTARKPAAVNVCTGQNRCFDNEKEIACPAEGEDFFGQDAQYARLGVCAPLSFSVNEDVPNEPVVIDNNTGNMWQRKIPPVEELYVEDVWHYCEDLVYGGYDDWGLPSMEDFMTIADYGRYDPAVDTEYFPLSGSFWTSTMESRYDMGGWYVMLMDYYTIFDFTIPSASSVMTYYADQGFLNTTEKYPHSFSIMCIRAAGTSTYKYSFTSEAFGEKVVWNNENDLIFAKTGNTQTWQEALKYCSELNYAGISDWRVPNVKELTFNSFGGARSSTTKLADQTSDYSPLPYDLSAKEDKFAATLCVANDPCEDGKFWNGKKCAKNPCAENPCLSFSHSDGSCKVMDEDNFACGCIDDYYFWNYDSKECVRSCYNNPCYYDENSDYECYPDEDNGYRCGCKAHFSWDPVNRKCFFDCNLNPCKNMEHSDGQCHENGNDGSYCGCVEGYAWFPHACLEDLCNPNPCENMANSYGTCEQKYYQTNKGYEIYYRCNCLEDYYWDTKYEECRKCHPGVC